MKWLVGLLWFVGCGGVIGATSDGGSDGATQGSCASNADCAAGYACLYPVTDGCSATRQCLPNMQCKGSKSCACDGTTIFACAGAAKPVAHLGPCADVTSPDGCTVACEQCDVSAYTPTPQSKPVTTLGACSSADIALFVSACLSASATSQSCQSWYGSDAGSCVPCVFTLSTAVTWGPLVCTNSGCTLNTGGCVDLTLGQVSQENATSTGSCGDYESAQLGCLDYACNACGNTSDFTACTTDSAQTGCKSYVDATTNAPACAALDAGATACFPQTDSQYAAFVNVFCGTGP